jgi:hypothetical protein
MAGAAPSFSEVHLVKALLALKEGKTGRKRLASLLGVGEGSVRTIIKKLSAEKLIASKPRGHELSSKGRQVVNGYLSRFSLPVGIGLDIAPGRKCCLVVVKGASERITNGLEEREVAVKSGAEGAILLKHSGGSITFPCGDILLDDYPMTKDFVMNAGTSEGDLVVVGFAGSFEKAADGAMAIVLSLVQ